MDVATIPDVAVAANTCVGDASRAVGVSSNGLLIAVTAGSWLEQAEARIATSKYVNQGCFTEHSAGLILNPSFL
jgi:hypothetical protein